MRRPIHVLDAPSNLGLRPPAEGVVPGVYKLAGTLRNQNLVARLGAIEAGVETPPRYEPRYVPEEGIRNGDALATYSIRLAKRLDELPQGFALVLGGDCSILVGIGLHLYRKGRVGLVFFDAHSDFRHPGNFPPIVAAAGEDLAIISGRGDTRLLALNQFRPMIELQDVVLVGVRPTDPALPELRALGAHVITSADLAGLSPQEAAGQIKSDLRQVGVEQYWIHFDADVIDGSEMPAVDCPEPAGPSSAYLADLLTLVAAPHGAIGLDIAIYDPDLDPDEQCARVLADMIVRALAQLTTTHDTRETNLEATSSRRGC